MSFCSTNAHLRVWFIEHLSLAQVAQQSVTKLISVTLFVTCLVTLKIGAKH
jgi:hypothetical protein